MEITNSRNKRFSGGDREILIKKKGVTYINITRWLPVEIQIGDRWIFLNDDFSKIVSDLKRDKRPYFIHKNEHGRRALFVPMKRTI